MQQSNVRELRRLLCASGERPTSDATEESNENAASHALPLRFDAQRL